MDTGKLCGGKSGPWPYIYGWTVQDVGDFIRDIGYPQYVHCFRNNCVNWQMLPRLNAYVLQRFGVTRMEHAMEIMAFINAVLRRKLYSYDSSDEPPRHSYLSNPQFERFKDKLPPAQKPISLHLTFKDYHLPKRDQGGQYNRCQYYNGTPYHKQCSITPLKQRKGIIGVRRPSFCLPCFY